MNETHRSGNWGISLIAPGEFRKSAAAVTTSSWQPTNSNRMTPLAKPGHIGGCGKGPHFAHRSQPFSVDKQGHFPWWL